MLPELEASVTLIIQGKGEDAVFAGERRFVVTDKTIILDISGQAVDLSELIVPCEAEIKYRLEPSEQDPECLKITVKRFYVE